MVWSYVENQKETVVGKKSQMSEQPRWRRDARIDRELEKLLMFELRLEADFIVS